MDYKQHPHRFLRHMLSGPFIWAVLLPLVLLDLVMELYHRICFPLYGLPYVERKNYIRIDRHKLQYLLWYDKLNCAYCGYANGLLHYASTIAARTEAYWCGIQHQQPPDFVPPAHHAKFWAYGDATVIQEGNSARSEKQENSN
jgi:hypothetical protein